MSRTPEQFKVTEEEILDVSLKHFSMHGYEGTNLNDIANELNITRTPIYYYFNNKLGLYESVTKRHLLSKKAQYTSIFTSDLPFFGEGPQGPSRIVAPEVVRAGPLCGHRHQPQAYGGA